MTSFNNLRSYLTNQIELEKLLIMVSEKKKSSIYGKSKNKGMQDINGIDLMNNYSLYNLHLTENAYLFNWREV